MIFLLATAAYAQECPDGYTCLTDDLYKELYGKMEELSAIEEGEPTITFDGSLYIITDDKGRVFTNATGEDAIYESSVTGKVVWGHVEADIVMKVDVDVSRREPATWGLRFRPKFLTSYLILQTDFDEPMQAVDFGLDVDFLYWHKWNLNAYLGARSLGTGVGFDVFEHSGTELAAHWAWPIGGNPFKLSPALGWYFAF